MLIPYNVDRPARNLPYVTYALMGINIFLFMVTVFISNVNLPSDNLRGKAAVEEIFENPETARVTVRKFMDRLRSQGFTLPDEMGTQDEAVDQFISALGEDEKRLVAATVAFDQKTGEGYDRYWQIKNSGSTYVMEPHYSALDLFAYHPGDQSVAGKLLGLLGSMFLHGDLEHIIGNMLFLWVFGRAIEDVLGPRVYLGAYVLCGIAATLLHHVMTLQFAPQSMFVPAFGASGAIMGVLGLFAPRFYRTPVRAYFMPLFMIGSAIVTGIIYGLTRDLGMSSFLAIIVTGGILYANREKLPWATRVFPAAWFIGAWIGYKDLYPAIHALTLKNGATNDGTAHWAHIGGFFFGVLYAFLIGAHKEGKQEFLLDDAEKAFNLGDMAGAVSYSQNVLEREPGNPGAYEVLSKAYMKQNNENDALDSFELAIINYLRTGERGKAAACYLIALEKFPLFILPAPTQLAIGNQMANEYSFKEAAETLVKIPYTFPDAPEGEVALLRAAQVYLQHLNQPQTTVQLLQFFLQKYPESQWLPQVERAWKMAHHQMMAPQQETAHEPLPAEPVKLRPKAVAPVSNGARTQQLPPRSPGG